MKRPHIAIQPYDGGEAIVFAADLMHLTLLAGHSSLASLHFADLTDAEAEQVVQWLKSRFAGRREHPHV